MRDSGGALDLDNNVPYCDVACSNVHVPAIFIASIDHLEGLERETHYASLTDADIQFVWRFIEGTVES